MLRGTLTSPYSGQQVDMDHESGTVEITGQTQPKIRDKAFYRAVQMVFQDPYGSLHPKKTVDDTLAEPLAIHGIGDAETRIGRAMSEVGLPSSFRFRYPHQLSGGQRQRVMIAMALILGPALLIADEPTTALDVTIQKQILDLLMSLQEDYGMGLILITHDMGVVAETADRVVVQYKGRKMEDADVLDLFENPQSPYTRALLAALPEHATGDRLPTVSDFFDKEAVR